MFDELGFVIICMFYYSGKEFSCGEVGEKCNIVKIIVFYYFKMLCEDIF